MLYAPSHTSLFHSPSNTKLFNVTLSNEWRILGVFRCGTREAIWGADPLEYWGGFSKISFEERANFTSPLASGGHVEWGIARANVTDSPGGRSRATLQISFPNVEWGFLQSVYGWSALQYQDWSRGYLHLNGSDNQTFAVFTDGILEFSIDGQRHFGGDFYSYRRAPLIVTLAPGEHVIELRLIRDVRTMGGEGHPVLDAVLEVEVRHGMLAIDEQSLLIPEATDWKLGTLDAPLLLAPFQIRPLAFQLAPETGTRGDAIINIHYRASQGIPQVQSFRVIFETRSLSQVQRLTYKHPAGIVSYATLRPPPSDSACGFSRTSVSLPVMIGLHGAGLDADSTRAREMLDAAYGLCAWVLIPSGVTSWSGDDWPPWMEAVGWNGPGVLVEDWMVVGHSNGGAWFLATHYPDNVFAVAPVSGYTSIENYVPYNMWHESEPLLSSILYRSRGSFKHELLLDNAAGIPILQQHGAADTNVPPSEYVELPNTSHWFDGVLTSRLLRFYEKSLRLKKNNIPEYYTINIPPLGDSICRGICVDQLQSPDRFGRLHVQRNIRQGIWQLRTQNIHRFHIAARVCGFQRHIVLVLEDADTQFKITATECESTWFVRDADERWTSSRQIRWQAISQRYGRQVGALDAILRTLGSFTIRTCSAGTDQVALQICRNLLQYFAADSSITAECSPLNETMPGNVITLSLANEVSHSTFSGYPIRVSNRRVIIHQGCSPAQIEASENWHIRPDQNCQKFTFEPKPAMGALFLHPLGNERLELIIWGTDLDGLKQVARLVPTLTGAGQPEFVILGGNSRWKGHAGLDAAGHLTSSGRSPQHHISQMAGR
ncbi:hypothetical protein BJY04DRAFT_208288 [Aspergillus karnatakaensis]|uniref:uncharacterized protein n=1 Tax=Aspergillus karnatakaensis TaxID=1810916 RepID=UPI003CCD0E00